MVEFIWDLGFRADEEGLFDEAAVLVMPESEGEGGAEEVGVLGGVSAFFNEVTGFSFGS